MTMDKHTTWLAYIWALISGICAQWTLNDYGALIGIVLGIGTFLVNKHYKKKSEQAQARQAAAMVNRPDFPGECFICELRLPDHCFRWKHNELFLLLPEEYGPAFPAIVDCYTSPPT